MEEQVNIPALGIVCIYMYVSTVRALYGYTFRKMETDSSEEVNSRLRSI